MGALADGCDELLYGRGIVWGQVSLHDTPPPVFRRQLEAGNVRPVGLESFYGKLLRRPVEYGDTVAVCARRLRSNHLVATRLTRINTFWEISLLEYYQVHIGLVHSTQVGFHAHVLTITDAVRSKTDRTYHPLSIVPTSPR